MRRIFTLVCVFFVIFSITVNAAYSGEKIYTSMERSFLWLDENASPLGDTDSVAADYYVMALSRANRAFDYGKYKKITESRTINTKYDAQRTIMANAACGGEFGEDFVGDNTYNCQYNTSMDIAGAVIAAENSGYSININGRNTDTLMAQLLGNQLPDGSFDGNVLATAKSIIALSFCSGKRYSVKGKNKGESYFYDVNTSILRGVNYLQKAKDEDCGFGSITDTAYVIMALDCAGIDADNDAGFSDGTQSTLSWIMNRRNDDGSFGDHKDDTATAVCALVSHLRAMQGKEGFFELRSEDKLDNPSDYTGDINRSGEGFKKHSADSEIIEIDTSEDNILQDTDNVRVHQDAVEDKNSDNRTNDTKKSDKSKVVLIVSAGVLVLGAVSAAVFITNYNRKKPMFKKHIGHSDDSDDDG